MRLLQRERNGEFSLVEFFGKNIPPYAILSHTWGADDQEVTFRDIVDATGKNKAGYRKIYFCEEQARRDGLQFFWVDTCCIDKSSSAELSEAINSMFRWYHDAAKCYIYLSDVSITDSVVFDPASFRQTWKLAFQRSRWFTRGWTLQELVAPTSVEFFSVEGELLGDRNSMVEEIAIITGIAVQALLGSPLSRFTVEERMSWAKRRVTKREEDAVYSLLGIFDIHIPLIYGEGQKSAWSRLLHEIQGSLKDKLFVLPSALIIGQQNRNRELFSTVPFSRDSNFADRPKSMFCSHLAKTTAEDDGANPLRDQSHHAVGEQMVNGGICNISDEASSRRDRFVGIANQQRVNGGTVDHSIRAGEGQGGHIVRDARGITVGGGRATGASMSLRDIQTFFGKVEGGVGIGASITT